MSEISVQLWMLLSKGERGIGQLFLCAGLLQWRKYAEVSVLSVMFSWRELLLGKSGSFSVLTQYNFSPRNPGIFFEKQKAELNPRPCWLAEVSCGDLNKIYSFY